MATWRMPLPTSTRRSSWPSCETPGAGEALKRNRQAHDSPEVSPKAHMIVHICNRILSCASARISFGIDIRSIHAEGDILTAMRRSPCDYKAFSRQARVKTVYTYDKHTLFAVPSRYTELSVANSNGGVSMYSPLDSQPYPTQVGCWQR